MNTVINQITNCIEQTYDFGGKDFHDRIVVFPYGDIGIRVVDIMRSVYDIEPFLILDNHKCKFNDAIKPISFLESLENCEYVLILATTKPETYLDVRECALKYVNCDNLIELESMQDRIRKDYDSLVYTDIGRHSFGPICRNHPFIKKIGAFCSFAPGVDVVMNHEMRFITTHPMIYAGQMYEDVTIDYESFSDKPWYIEGARPQPVVKPVKRITIGNDVWLGRNVIVTNYANIGNGVIAGAGAVITKDIPDYAVVTGAPARIIRYRYDSDQIEKLNKIKWWDWSDEEICNRFEDFYLSADEFISKYFCKI